MYIEYATLFNTMTECLVSFDSIETEGTTHLAMCPCTLTLYLVGKVPCSVTVRLGLRVS